MKKLKSVGTALSVILTCTIGSDLQGARHLLSSNPGMMPGRTRRI